MEIIKCKWKGGAKAPVMLMIDDLANKYMVDKNAGEYLGADWGGRGRKKNSFIQIVDENLVRCFPYLRITLFLVTGKRADIIENGKKSYKNVCSSDSVFTAFLNEILCDPHYEIAYHGLNHGKIQDNVFIQEWALFNSIHEAKEQIRKGVGEYKKATGEVFRGGKYCGYISNIYSDSSIEEMGFSWWCRHFDGALFTREKANKKYSLEVEKFGSVVDIPTTIDGNLISLHEINKLFSREYLKAIYYKIKYKESIESIINTLINNGQIISIQEHTSPFREDNHIQYPNIVTDMSHLKWLFSYLQKYDLWYATGSEIADYYQAYKESNICVEGNKIKVKSNNGKKCHIDLLIIPDVGKGQVSLFNSENIPLLCKNNKNIFTLEVTGQEEVYRIEEL